MDDHPQPFGDPRKAKNYVRAALNELLGVKQQDWESENIDTKEFFAKFGHRLPPAIREEHDKLSRRFHRAVTAQISS